MTGRVPARDGVYYAPVAHGRRGPEPLSSQPGAARLDRDGELDLEDARPVELALRRDELVVSHCQEPMDFGEDRSRGVLVVAAVRAGCDYRRQRSDRQRRGGKDGMCK